MIDTAVLKAFGIDESITVQRLSSGLINETYKITDSKDKALLLQKINTKVFTDVAAIQKNYQIIQQHLKDRNSFILPQIIFTDKKETLYTQEVFTWRCFEFIQNTYSSLVSSDAKEAYEVANCFGKFSADLSDLDPNKITVILPGFHDLQLRYFQFESALKAASQEKKNESRALINKANEYKFLVDFYDKISNSSVNFPLHILHHDCKIANILFNKDSSSVYCPIDLDTTQPGLFFSDFGDMVRSMTPNISENEADIDNMFLRTDFYEGIKDGYLTAMQNFLTKDELENIDMSGKIIIYMQGLRFLTDHLNGNIYYHVNYPEQNKLRAENQFRLLSLLDEYIKNLKASKIYFAI